MLFLIYERQSTLNLHVHESAVHLLLLSASTFVLDFVSRSHALTYA